MHRLVSARGRGLRRPAGRRGSPASRSFSATPLPRRQGQPSNTSPRPSTSGNVSTVTAATPVTVTLEMIYEECKTRNNMLDRKLSEVDNKVTNMSSLLKVLHVLMKQHCKRSFTIKGSRYED